MPKQIKISDDLYERLRDIGDGKSMTQTISDLLEGNPAKRDDTADLYQFLVDNFNRLERKIDGLGSTPEKNLGDFASEKNIKSENPADIQQLLIKRSRVIRDLDERNIMAWVQKRASEEFWADEQAQIEMKKHREQLEQERDALDAQLHELGV